ncbi:MAG: hypothetical protein HY708_08295 [Ignavibacteriae bacterium]|nr:hypothetical protein [Ignavibacteriota bacterium]
MESFLVYAQLLALLCVSALCIFLMFVLVRVKEILNTVESDLKEVTTRAVPVLENMEYISSRVKNITDNIDDQVMMVHESIGSVRQVVDSIVELERKVQARIEGPLLDGVAFIAALFKGVRTFVERVRA